MVDQECLCVISGLVDIQGCSNRLFPGGMGMAEPCSEEFIQEYDVGELSEPGISGEDFFPS